MKAFSCIGSSTKLNKTTEMNMKVLLNKKIIVGLAKEIQPKYYSETDSDFQYILVCRVINVVRKYKTVDM